MSGSDKTLSDLIVAMQYLNSRPLYEMWMPAIKSRDVRKAKSLTPEQTQQLLESKHVEPLPPGAQKRGTFHCFLVDEPKRLRIVEHTAAANDHLPAAPSVTFTSLSELMQIVHSGQFAAHVDFAAYYQQFPLGENVRDFFTAKMPVRAPDGSVSWETFQLCVGPTGMAHMVYVACATTARVTDFVTSGGRDTYIDNILFTADSREALVADLTVFKERCAACSITVNEDMNDLPSLISRTTTYRGITFDMTEKTACLSDKTVNKIKLSLSLIDSWTYRGFAAHLGLLFYSMQIIEIPVHSFFNLLRFVSHVGRIMQEAQDARWDEQVEIWQSARVQLEAWTEIAIRNEPRVIQKKRDADVLVLVDACRTGCGYVAVDLRSNEVFYHSETWSAEFTRQHGEEKLQRSVFTEPHGMLVMKRHLLQRLRDVPTSFLVGTDNVTAKAVFRRGYASRSFDLNCVASLDRSCVDRRHQWEYVHIPGKLNVLADALSRGAASLTSEEVLGVPVSLRRLLGVLPGGSSSGVGA